MRHIIKSLTICILLISCIDEKVAPNSEWTYSGYLYEDCSEEKVFAGLELNFYDHSLGGIGLKEKNDFKGTVYTDSNGYYTITAKFRHDDVVVKDQHDRLIFRMRNELSTMGQRVNSTITWYNHPVSYHPVKILTNKSYSNQDTIYLGAKGGSYIDTLLTGPYVNNQVFENIIFHTPFLSNGYVSATSDSEIKTNVVWGLGRNSYDSTAKNVIGREQFYVKNIKQWMCKSGDTIVVDLRVLD